MQENNNIRYEKFQMKDIRESILLSPEEYAQMAREGKLPKLKSLKDKGTLEKSTDK